jgi:type I restriction enzyme R subunit
VIEAKRVGLATAEGVQQAKEYIKYLNAPFACATNGATWYEINMAGGEAEVAGLPSPQTLWDRAFQVPNAWRPSFGAVPFELGGGKWEPRYYQHNVISAALEAIATGQCRILLTLATGTGKPASRFNCAGNCLRQGGT